MQSKDYPNSTFKLGRKHKYCFKLVQGVKNKSCTSYFHKQYKKKQHVKQESNKLHQESSSPHSHDIRIWRQSRLCIHPKKITYRLLNIFTIDGDITIPSFPASLN